MKTKVNIIVFGKFHAFDLASFLYKQGYLKNLITSFPVYKVHEVDKRIPKDKIKSFFILEIISRGLKKLNLSSQKIDDYIKLIFQKMRALLGCSLSVCLNAARVLLGRRLGAARECAFKCCLGAAWVLLECV